MAIAGELVSSRVSPERVNRSQVWNLSQNWLPAISVNQSAPKQTPSAEMGLLSDCHPPEPLPRADRAEVPSGASRVGAADRHRFPKRWGESERRRAARTGTRRAHITRNTNPPRFSVLSFSPLRSCEFEAEAVCITTRSAFPKPLPRTGEGEKIAASDFDIFFSLSDDLFLS